MKSLKTKDKYFLISLCIFVLLSIFVLSLTVVNVRIDAQSVGDPPTPIVSPSPTDEMPGLFEYEYHIPYLIKSS